MDVRQLVEDGDTRAITEAVEAMVERVQAYVGGYRLKQAVHFETFTDDDPLVAPDLGWRGRGLKVSVYLEIEGAAHYLPSYAGNLDIMTSAALRTGERLTQRRQAVSA